MVTMAALVTVGADENTGGMAEVVAAVVGMMAAVENPEPDMADTRLLERGILRKEYECEVEGLGLNGRRRAGGAVLGAEGLGLSRGRER